MARAIRDKGAQTFCDLAGTWTIDHALRRLVGSNPGRGRPGRAARSVPLPAEIMAQLKAFKRPWGQQFTPATHCGQRRGSHEKGLA